MTNRKPLPSQEDLLKHFSYCPKTGALSWRLPTSNRCKPGDLILRSTPKDGYLICVLFGEPYMQHRVIWKMMTGKDPIEEIDHENLCRVDNRWGNLREADHHQQMANRPVPKHNTSGHKGVRWFEKEQKWFAVINSKGKRYELGRHIRKEDAIAAYEAASRRLHGEYGRS